MATDWAGLEFGDLLDFFVRPETGSILQYYFEADADEDRVPEMIPDLTPGSEYSKWFTDGLEFAFIKYGWKNPHYWSYRDEKDLDPSKEWMLVRPDRFPTMRMLSDTASATRSETVAPEGGRLTYPPSLSTSSSKSSRTLGHRKQLLKHSTILCPTSVTS